MATKDERIIEIIVNGQKANANLKELEGASKALSSQLKTLAPGTAEFVEKSKQLREVKSRVTEVKESIAGVTKEQTLMSEGFSRMVGAVAPLELIFKAIEFGKQSLGDFKEAQQAQAGLDATLASTQHQAGLTSQALGDLATAQQHATLFDDDDTKGAESLLLTFTNIRKGVYEEAIPAIEDMATKMANGGEADLKSASIQVGKALNDPIKGLSALSKVGVTFSETQKETITKMMETGDVAGAQRIMLAELNKEFGGSAVAARKAAGAQGDFKDTMMDLGEAVGSLISDGLDLLYPLVLQLVSGFLILANSVRTLPEFVRENKDVMIALGVAILSLNGANIAAAASTLYMTAVEKGRSIATKASATAQWLLNAAMTANPIGLVIAAVALLVGGFIKLYNSSQTVRAGIAGLAAAAVQIFENIKHAAMEHLSGIADILAGIFTGDWGRIKQGANKLIDSVKGLGKDVGKSYSDGYHGKVAEEAAAAEAARKANGQKKVQEAGAQGAAEGEEENSAQRKAREKREKEAEAARKKAHAASERDAKKHHQELLKARDEFHKATLKADLEFEKLKVEAMDEGIDKVLAKLKLQRDEELKQLGQKKKDVMANVAATATDKAHLLDQYHQTEVMAEKRYQADKKQALEKQAENDRKDEFARLDAEEDEKLVILDNAWLQEKSHLKKQTLEFMKAEQARATAEIKLRLKTAKAKLALMKAEGKSETTEGRKLKNAILKIEGELGEQQVSGEKAVSDFKKNEAKKRFDSEVAFAQSGIELGNMVLDGLMERLDKEGAAYAAAKEAKKIIAIAEIAINLQKELMANSLAAAENPTNGVTFGAAGTAQLVIQDALSIGRSVIAAATVMGFAGGGYTGPGSGQRDSTGFRVAGTVHEGEWVAPKWMLESPKYANIVGYLEAERRGYAQGGYTSPPALPPSAATGGSQADDSTVAAIKENTAELRAFRKDLTTWATNLNVDYHAGNASEAMALRQKLKSSSGL